MKLIFIMSIVLSFAILITVRSYNNFAICINGNIQRLELGSKIENLIASNLLDGNNLYIFIQLEPFNVHILNQTARYDNALYINYTDAQLYNFINDETMKIINKHRNSSNIGKLKLHVRYTKPIQKYFQIINHTVPITEPYYSRTPYEQFQLGFRQYNAIRQCISWTQEFEIRNRFLFNYFVRIREDTVIMKPWIFQPIEWRNMLITTDYAQWYGICDRWFIIDRKYLNTFARGLVENYYLNYSVVSTYWLNMESLVARCINNQKIPIIALNVCEMPLITIRNIVEGSWYIDGASIGDLLDNVYVIKNPCIVNYKWDDIFWSGYVNLHSIDKLKFKSHN